MIMHILCIVYFYPSFPCWQALLYIFDQSSTSKKPCHYRLTKGSERNHARLLRHHLYCSAECAQKMIHDGSAKNYRQVQSHGSWKPSLNPNAATTNGCNYCPHTYITKHYCASLNRITYFGDVIYIVPNS